jgi:hypothetical protein
VTEPIITKKISAVYLEEPRRDDEAPDGAHVGYGGVTRIERRDENYGILGLAWYDVFAGDVLLKSFNARSVAVIHYEKPKS